MAASHLQVQEDGSLVSRQTILWSNGKTEQENIIRFIFERDNWSVSEISNINGSFWKLTCSCQVKLLKINLYISSIRDESRAEDEFKMQLGNSYPENEEAGWITLVLGIYTIPKENGSFEYILSGYDQWKRFDFSGNPSIRGTRTRGLQNAKIFGFQKVEKSFLFRPEFIYYYINNLNNLRDNIGISKPIIEKKWEQIIYFGAPGTGKSFKVEHREGETEDDRIRTTFHPDTDYSSFVGCYKPIEDGNRITYRFEGQCFAKAYVEAWKRLVDRAADQNINYTLIIEEINRGNCAQIFGDIFQLLDRDENGFSQYGIEPDEDLAKYLREQFDNIKEQLIGINYSKIASGKEMKLPPNLSIIATMNTSDQSLFPIDSAFKRRWDWEYIPIQYSPIDEATNNPIVNKIDIDGTLYDWGKFINEVNQRIYKITKSEDKQLGYFFVKPDVGSKITLKRFVSKVIFYLWSDIYKDYAGRDTSIFKIDGEHVSFNKFFDNNNIQIGLVKSFIEQFIKSDDIEETIDISSDGNPINKKRLSRIKDIIDKINEIGPENVATDTRFETFKPGGNVKFVGKIEITKSESMNDSTFKKYRSEQYPLNGGYYIAVYNFSNERLEEIRQLLGIQTQK